MATCELFVFVENHPGFPSVKAVARTSQTVEHLVFGDVAVLIHSKKSHCHGPAEISHGSICGSES